jgi:hypothetical protein
MSRKITIKELLDNRFKTGSRSHYGPVKVYDICATDFLEDSKGKDLRQRVNALGNVKRAIECRVDVILYNYCLHKKSEKEGWNFPEKVEVIQQLGIVAPRILKKINQKRNELEHRYLEPTQDDVDDALDVATLFLAYTDDIENNSLKKYGTPDDFDIELKIMDGIVRLIDYKNNVRQNVKIDSDDGWIEFAKRLPKFRA